jgi:hypothetical protein
VLGRRLMCSMGMLQTFGRRWMMLLQRVAFGISMDSRGGLDTDDASACLGHAGGGWGVGGVGGGRRRQFAGGGSWPLRQYINQLSAVNRFGLPLENTFYCHASREHILLLSPPLPEETSDRIR